MCGLFGFTDPRHALYPKQARQLINALARASMERGTDATGIAYVAATQLTIYKRPKPADRMYLHPTGDPQVMMGHVRMTTQGDAKLNANNHPFAGHLGHLGGGSPDFALAHNGVLYNDRQLVKQHKLPKTKIETDSYVAVQLLEAAGVLSMESVKQVCEALEGTFNFTILTRYDDLYLVRGNNPLCVWRYPRLGLTVYASTESILREAVSKIRFLRHMSTIEISLMEGEILLIHPDGSQEHERFTVRPDYRFRYAVWDDWAQYDGFPAKRAAKKDRRTGPVMDLLATASNYGYDNENIELLLDYGYSPDEVEMMLDEPELLQASVREATYYSAFV